jgi:hypothetical protein
MALRLAVLQLPNREKKIIISYFKTLIEIT